VGCERSPSAVLPVEQRHVAVPSERRLLRVPQTRRVRMVRRAGVLLRLLRWLLRRRSERLLLWLLHGLRAHQVRRGLVLLRQWRAVLLLRLLLRVPQCLLVARVESRLRLLLLRRGVVRVRMRMRMQRLERIVTTGAAKRVAAMRPPERGGGEAAQRAAAVGLVRRCVKHVLRVKQRLRRRGAVHRLADAEIHAAQRANRCSERIVHVTLTKS